MTEPPARRPGDPEPHPTSDDPKQRAARAARSDDDWTQAGDAASQEDENLLERTRVSQTWIALIVFAVVLILLLVFVLQNTKRVSITYLGFDGDLPLAVAMLLSAVAGVLLAAIAGTLRILQLRRRVRRGQRPRA